MKEISIKLNKKVAKAFKNATREDQQRMEKIINEVVEYVLHERQVKDFLKARTQLSEEAIANGLTPEMLDSLSKDEG